ncbi:hypothetical protein DH2020_017252 [Rehmannia glutinosa]|uniref:RIN4 pathogenic type III effector avirulence factor Avr cleavage site domain-containing protein n=1 Tax=Rehmannia glutinosa TaxID=99300 RepID=A0ABR0WTQ9_REHGL
MTCLQQRSHVPKFGNWDGDNVPYTAYFENARKEKTGGVRINPNDPEQNPEAFSIGGPSSNVSQISPDNHVARKKFVHQRNAYDQQKSASPKTLASQSSSDKSPSDNSVTSVLRPNHQRKKSDRSKYASDIRYPPSPGPNSFNPADDYSYRSVSVPKFGQWDETDPRSAEGFTVIFNKVKEEKQIAAAKFPPVPLQTTNNYQTNQKEETRKKCCCLF